MYRFFSRTKEKKGPIEVGLKIGPVPGMDDGPPKLIISALNVGDDAIVLDGPGIRLPDNRNIILPMPLGRVRFPTVIHRDEDCFVWTDLFTLADNLNARKYSGNCPIIGYFNSGLGKHAVLYVSEPININIDEILGQPLS